MPIALAQQALSHQQEPQAQIQQGSIKNTERGRHSSRPKKTRGDVPEQAWLSARVRKLDAMKWKALATRHRDNGAVHLLEPVSRGVAFSWSRCCFGCPDHASHKLCCACDCLIYHNRRCRALGKGTTFAVEVTVHRDSVVCDGRTDLIAVVVRVIDIPRSRLWAVICRGEVCFFSTTPMTGAGDCQRISRNKTGVYLKPRKHSAETNTSTGEIRGVLLADSSKLFTKAILPSECLFGQLLLFLVTRVSCGLMPQLILLFGGEVKQQVLKSHFNLC